MGEEIVPIVMFIAIAVAVIGGFYFKFRGRAAVQETIRTALEQGQQISPELLAELAGDQSPPPTAGSPGGWGRRRAGRGEGLTAR